MGNVAGPETRGADQFGDLTTHFWAKKRKTGRNTVALEHRLWTAHLLKPLTMILEMCLP